MAKKYTFSRSILNDKDQLEVFTANEFDSFEEAITAVNKGIRDRFYGIGGGIGKVVEDKNKSNKVVPIN